MKLFIFLENIGGAKISQGDAIFKPRCACASVTVVVLCVSAKLLSIAYSGVEFTCNVFNPRRMCKGYGGGAVCACMCLAYQSTCSSYIPCLYVENKVSSGSLR